MAVFEFASGQAVELYADIYPAVVNPVPEGIPTGTRYRAIVHQFGVTVGWSVRNNGRPVIESVELPFTPEQLADVSFRGGSIKAEDGTVLLTVDRASACSTCGSQSIKTWTPYPGVIWTSVPRKATAEDQYRQQRSTWSYGVPPQRRT